MPDTADLIRRAREVADELADPCAEVHDLSEERIEAAVLLRQFADMIEQGDAGRLISKAREYAKLAPDEDISRGALYDLLRFASKHSGDWDEYERPPCTDDYDLLASAPEMARLLAQVADELERLHEENKRLRACVGTRLHPKNRS